MGSYVVLDLTVVLPWIVLFCLWVFRLVILNCLELLIDLGLVYAGFWFIMLLDLIVVVWVLNLCVVCI